MNLDLMLDSGAFTAWRKKSSVDLEEYINYIRKNCEHIDIAVNLDVIPGEFGRVPEPAEVEASAQQGWNNMLTMEAEGIFPMPVFHMGESFKWLHRMIEHGSRYIGISPANDRTTNEKILWLDRVFVEIVDSKGWPVVKTHAFGVTSVPILFRYPWYSADSAAWVFTAATGGIMVPKSKNGFFNYSEKPYVVSVSTREKEKSGSSTHFLQMSDAIKEYVEVFLAHCGVTLEQVKTDYRARAKVNVMFFLGVEKNRPDLPFKSVHRRFFEDE